MSAPSPAPPLAITMGDPAGIGPELLLKAWLARDRLAAPFFAIADPQLLRETARRLGVAAPIAIIEPRECRGVFDKALPVAPLANAVAADPGAPSPAFAPAILESIERAVDYVLSGLASAVVTNPIAKSALYEAGFAFPGHTEFLGELSRRRGRAAQPVMMLYCEALCVVPITVHIPLSAVPKSLNAPLIVATARIVADEMRRRFGVAHPRLAVSGLNPHAGEGGAMGREEIEIIAPALAELRAGGFDIAGPLPADTMFHAAARSRYDVALTMYHDQGLIPVKTLAFDTGVNVTLGLPFVRTSPDHGTAFDIAGKGVANPASLIAAAQLAARLAGA